MQPIASPDPEDSSVLRQSAERPPVRPRFASTEALQDPTLRTPGSEISEAVSASSYRETFPFNRPFGEPQERRRSPNPRLALLVGLILLAIAATTAIYLYRDTHTQVLRPGAVHSSFRVESQTAALTAI